MSWQWAASFALALIVMLFGVAALVERRGARFAAGPRLRHAAYTLALGVYCSSWTFYGAVGSVVRDGWNYLPIYLAPILLLLLAPRFLRSLSRAVAEEQAATVSDFIAARFGHDVVVARLVTVIALLGTVPYVALQFRSIGNAMALVSGQPVAGPAMIAAAALLALFAILFGARRFELSGRSEGLVFAIGLDSLIKLIALVAVAALAGMLLLQADPGQIAVGLDAVGSGFRADRINLETGAIFLISILAVLVLPRQFYMALAEAREPEDLVRSRFGLAAYIAIMAAVAIPIAMAGAMLFGPGVPPDVYVLDIPAVTGSRAVLAVALLGGISAAASMVIVDSTALATMVSNDLIFPTILARSADGPAGALGRQMLRVRRLSIIGIVSAALAWALLVDSRNSLASIGLVAFVAMAQFSPHLLLATQSGGQDRLAARASLSVGLALWLYTLALPPILPDVWLSAMRAGPFDPLDLFGIGRASPLVHGVGWSLGANLAVYALVAARKVRPAPLQTWMGPRWSGSGRAVSDIGDLHRLVASFVGADVATREFPPPRHASPIDRQSAQRAQELIARVVGASSARALVASALAGGQMDLSDVARLLDEGAQSLRFSRQLLAATFENIDAGISVVDAEMNLVAWNSRYLDIFNYSPGLIRVGAPVADLIRHNARSGDFGPGEVESHVAKRLAHMRRGLPHSFERRRSDGRVIKTTGGPMPGGGYVMSFTDVTAEAMVREELEQTLIELETRVADRTRELSEANHRLARATQDKTRFLAAASHDLIQPLHAAALARDPGLTRPDLVARLDRSIVAGENLLKALLDISKLDAGGVQPACSAVALEPFLRDLADTVRPLAAEHGLAFRVGPLHGTVHTDPVLLRSIIQNFLTNAVRYTERGGILLGVRQRGGDVRIDVIDTGVGIPPDQQEEIFGEFTRVGEVEAEGLGLGLAIARRIAQLLGGRIELASVLGKGSRFSLLLPRSAELPVAPVAPPTALHPTRNFTVLVVDNEPEIVAASLALLAAMGHRGLGAGGLSDAAELASDADIVLADYRLDAGEDGLSLIAALRSQGFEMPAVLVTAERDASLMAQAAAAGIELVSKPLDPLALEALLARLSVP
jgi:Na+/proline symporter/CheY-like chemotaxis protein